MANLTEPDATYPIEVQLPNLPDIPGLDNPQLRDFLIAVKTTLEILTGEHESSDKILIELINQEKN
jgi:hypothetical protein